MPNIELVVKIPEEIYKASHVIDVKYEDVVQIPLEVIANGAPLPKGHGKLIDTNNLKHAFISWSMAVQGLFTNADIESVIDNSTPIIEADVESEDK